MTYFKAFIEVRIELIMKSGETSKVLSIFINITIEGGLQLHNSKQQMLEKLFLVSTNLL